MVTKSEDMNISSKPTDFYMEGSETFQVHSYTKGVEPSVFPSFTAVPLQNIKRANYAADMYRNAIHAQPCIWIVENSGSKLIQDKYAMPCFGKSEVPREWMEVLSLHMLRRKIPCIMKHLMNLTLMTRTIKHCVLCTYVYSNKYQR